MRPSVLSSCGERLPQGLAILLTTHNAVFGYEADRVITIEDGRIVREEFGRRGLVGEVAGTIGLCESCAFAS